jgi:hypothetical protein
MEKEGALHENFSDHTEIKGSSDRSFGLVFTIVFLIVGLWPLKTGGTIRWWAIVTGGILCMVALFCPKVLSFPNRLWFRFGLLLQKIISPLIMGILFYGVAFPTGLLVRMLGMDILRLKWEPRAGTYWILRKPPGPPPETMKHQF